MQLRELREYAQRRELQIRRGRTEETASLLEENARLPTALYFLLAIWTGGTDASLWEQ